MAVNLVQHRDQMNFLISVPDTLQRIVSLVPSQTEFLCDLGLEKNIVGITKFCIHPSSCYQTKIRVGGTKDFSLETIRLLNPDIIIANKEENDEEQILKLKSIYPVWISDVRSLAHAEDMMRRLGEVFHREEKAQEIIKKIQHNFLKIQPLNQPLRTTYFIWRKPYMSVNKDTFIHDMLQRIGFENCFANSRARYPKITEAMLKEANPEVILLSSEPYPFKEKHFEEIHAVCPKARIFLVNGEMFSWYGSRLIQSPAYFQKLIKKLAE
ncbi:MAG: helical backbone metal receptor [Flavobacteriales bacterium]|nr:helical backbone metal receptor [Flavobacteriales bacterium]